MIRSLRLHRCTSRFVAFIGILQESPFETGLRSKIRDVHQHSLRHKYILVYSKFINKRARAFAFIMGKSTAATPAHPEHQPVRWQEFHDVATNPPHNSHFGTCRNVRHSGRPIAPRTVLPDKARSRQTHNQGSNYQYLGRRRTDTRR